MFPEKGFLTKAVSAVAITASLAGCMQEEEVNPYADVSIADNTSPESTRRIWETTKAYKARIEESVYDYQPVSLDDQLASIGKGVKADIPGLTEDIYSKNTSLSYAGNFNELSQHYAVAQACFESEATIKPAEKKSTDYSEKELEDLTVVNSYGHHLDSVNQRKIAQCITAALKPNQP